MENTTEVEQWKSECEAFQKWFSDLGGNIANNQQMSEAFRRIEAKSVSDNRLYELLGNDDKPFSKCLTCEYSACQNHGKCIKEN
jgi:hypothetical protein